MPNETATLTPGTEIKLTPEQIASFQPAADPVFPNPSMGNDNGIPATPQPASNNLPPGTKVKLDPAQAAAFRKSTGQLDPLLDFTSDQLASLQQQTPEFNPVQEFSNRPEAQTPDIKQKVADAFHIARTTQNFGKQFLGIEPGAGVAENALNIGEKIGTTAWDIAKGFGKQAWNYAQGFATPVGAMITAPFTTPETTKNMLDIGQRQIAENLAGSETAIAQAGKMTSEAGKFIARGTRLQKPLAQYGPEDKLAALDSELAANRIFKATESGKGPILSAVGSTVVKDLENAGLPIRPEETQALAAGDPFTWYAMGKAFHGAGGLVPEGVSAMASRGANAVGDFAAKYGGKTVEGIADLANMGANAVAKVAPVASAVLGAVKGAELHGPAGLVTGAGLGYKAGKGIAEGLKNVGAKAESVSQIGEQISGAKSIVSPLAQVGRDVLQTAPSAIADITKGVGFDLGLAAVTSEESPEQRAGIGIGTAFGALGAGKRMGGRVLSGQIIAPREYGANISVPSSGSFPALDASNTEATKTATPGVITRLNAIRSFLRGAAPNTDVFLASDPAQLEATLTQAGMSADQAKQYAAQEGFFTTSLPDKNGNQRNVIVVRNPDAAPHEAFHGIQDVLGESANREIDKIVQQAYTPQEFDAIGQDYARRLVGGQTLQNKGWREAILDQSGWGRAEAAEKIALEVSNRLQGEQGIQPDPQTVKTMAEAEWNRRLVEAAKRNPQTPVSDLQDTIWRDILTPEEAQAKADQYISRELAAENFDALFKHTGQTMTDPKGIVPKLAKIIGNLVTAAGGEPLAGRVSETGQYPLRSSVVEAVRGVTGATEKPVIEPNKPATIAPRIPVTPGGKGIPATPEGQQQAADEARTIAASAPDVAPALPSLPTGPNLPPSKPGTTGNLPTPQSPRDILTKIADAIANRSGVKINYLSAPDEPAAATTSSRPVRRAIIEAFRTMPAAARALWEKSFFPERVIQTKNGKYQVLGWAPEVFASNAHKLAQTLVDLPGVASPYELDPKTRTFSEAGWRELFTDAQQFVQNQISGTTGAGEPLVVPTAIEEAGFQKPRQAGIEAPLDQRKADFLNTLFNFKIPETPRITGGKLPLNIAGQAVSEATKPGRLSVPVEPKAPFTGEAAQKLGIEGKPILEVNPFRAELEQAAKAAGIPKPSFIEAIQRLGLENIKEVQVAPELPQFRGNTLTLTAGFQPQSAKAAMDQMKSMSQDEWMKIGQSYKGKYGGGITGWAVDQGVQAKTPQDLQEFRNAHQYFSDLRKDAMSTKNWDLVGSLATKAQAAREAFEAATGKQIDNPDTESGTKQFIQKYVDPGFVAPMEKTQFMPNRADAEEIQKEIFPLFKKHGLNFDLVGSLNKGGTGKDIDFAIRSEGKSLEGQLKPILEDVFPALDKKGWKTFPNPLERADGPGWFVSAESPSGHTVDFFVNGPFEADMSAQFQPSKEPNAIKSAATRDDETGKIYTGSWHGDSTLKYLNDKFPNNTPEDNALQADYVQKGVTDGFVTNSGEFLNRNEAAARAVEMAQITADQAKRMGWLESDQFKKAQLGQFQPSTEPRAIKSPAVQDESGKLFLGPSHLEAYQTAGRPMPDITKFKEGFVTNEGEFINRKEAFNRAVEFNQLKTKFPKTGSLNSENLSRSEAMSGKIFGLKSEDIKTPLESPKAVAEKYAADKWISKYNPPEKAVSVNEDLAKRIADFYDTTQNDPNDAAVKASYDALARETLRQYQYIRNAGYDIEPWTKGGEPYANSTEMVKDVTDNKHLFFKPTGNDIDPENLMAEPSGVGNFSLNDIFRAVHDFFGHAKTGNQFGPKGELNAWREHSAMYGPEAQGALAAETLAQNSWVNYGPHLRNETGAVAKKGEPGYKGLAERPFAEQKNIVIPPELLSEAKGQFSPKKKEDQPGYYDKYNVTPKTSDWTLQPGQSGFSKAWITPSGSPIQLGGQWHHDYMNAHPELGLPKSEEADIVRAAALKKGYARANYDNRNGVLTVEARAANWNKLKPAVEKLVESNLDKIDKMQVYLFNSNVDKVADSDNASFFDKKSDAEKLASIPFITGSEPRVQFQPDESVPEGSYRVWFRGRGNNPAVIRTKQGTTKQELENVYRKLEGLPESKNPSKSFQLTKLEGIPTWDYHMEEGPKDVQPRATQFQPNKAPDTGNFSNPDFESQLESIRAGQAGGQTFTPAGEVWTPAKDAKFDIVSLASVNVPQGELTKENFIDAVKPYESLLAEPNIVAGVYSFSKEGKPTVSIDINAVVPQKYRANTMAFAKDNDQRAIWDTAKSEEVNTGGLGNTKLNTPEQILDAVDSLSRGKKVSVDDILKQHAEPGAQSEQLGLGDLGGKEPMTTQQLANATKAEIAARYPEAVIARRKNESIPSDIVNSPLAKEAGSESKAVDAFARRLVEFAKEYSDNPIYKAGLRWYKDFVPQLKKQFGADAQTFAELLAATSPQTGVTTNFGYAYDALQGLKSGRFKKLIPKFEEGLNKIADDTWEPWYKRNAATPVANPSPAAFLAEWINKYDLKPRQSNGSLYGQHSVPVLRVFANDWLEKTAGPKTQNFVKNLLGTGHDATIDVWADRTMRRLGYSGFNDRWRILPQNGTGVSDADFAFSQKAFAKAAKELGVKADDLQGGLWFAEKQHWADNGWSRLDLGSFQKEMEKIPLLKAGIEQRLKKTKAENKAPKAEQLGFAIEPRNLK